MKLLSFIVAVVVAIVFVVAAIATLPVVLLDVVVRGE
jgi:hypothetical protein